MFEDKKRLDPLDPACGMVSIPDLYLKYLVNAG
jgi:hypothetical protein